MGLSLRSYLLAVAMSCVLLAYWTKLTKEAFFNNGPHQHNLQAGQETELLSETAAGDTDQEFGNSAPVLIFEAAPVGAPAWHVQPERCAPKLQFQTKLPQIK
jgi:hypothetical protein